MDKKVEEFITKKALEGDFEAQGLLLKYYGKHEFIDKGDDMKRYQKLQTMLHTVDTNYRIQPNSVSFEWDEYDIYKQDRLIYEGATLQQLEMFVFGVFSVKHNIDFDDFVLSSILDWIKFP